MTPEQNKIRSNTFTIRWDEKTGQYKVSWPGNDIVGTAPIEVIPVSIMEEVYGKK